MSQPVFPIDSDSLLAEAATVREIGRSHAESYRSGRPYHHICLDGFLPDAVIDRVRNDIASLPDAESSFGRAQENLKSSYNPERLPQYTRNLFHAFNSRPFILFLEEMTGITGLIPDPYFIGAGLHKTLNGGHLDIHADFNVHKQMQVERRLNVLIYLNDDWQEAWGGCFEIWDREMTGRVARFEPIKNRMVCFSTGSDTFHGNPEPVNHPAGEPRQSIALYYYTATWNETRKEHTTLFRPRPDSADKADRAVARRAVIKDILPPALYRRIGGRLKQIGF